eukprot:30942-Pelagococcus_subviridis.AAC.22
MRSCTRTRLVALQICPFVQKHPNIAHSTATSTSTSSNTTSVDFPPSSSEQGFGSSEHARATRLPVANDPVNAILSIPGATHTAAPASAPAPVTTLKTPGGTPATRATSASSRQVKDASSDGFKTTAQPAASAGATFQTAMSNG